MSSDTRTHNKQPHKMICPHCGHHMLVRKTKTISDTVREIWYDCSNVEKCGFRVVFGQQPIRVLSDSLTPNPLISIPNSRRVQSLQRIESERNKS